MANEIRTVDDLRNAYPQLVGEIETAAARNAEAAERKRIEDIEEMAIPGNEAQTQEAKFTKPVSAAEHAVAVAKWVKANGSTYLNGVAADVANSGMGGVNNEATGGQKPDTFMDALHTVGGKK